MRANSISTAVLIVTIVTLLVVLAFRVRVGATADAIVVLQTTGMTCDFCSSSITTALEREQGVAATEVDVAKGWVFVGYDPQIIKPETLALKVAEAGFYCNVYAVQTPEQFKQVTGREFGIKAMAAKACGGCGANSGCGTSHQK